MEYVVKYTLLNPIDNIILVESGYSQDVCVPLLAGPITDHAMLLSSINTSQNEQVNNPAYAVPNQVAGDGVVYEDMPSEDVAVRAPAVTAFTSDERYSKLQRDSSVLTQSTTTPITGDGYDDVEAYYGRLDNTEQYIVSIGCCEI